MKILTLLQHGYLNDSHKNYYEARQLLRLGVC